MRSCEMPSGVPLPRRFHSQSYFQHSGQELDDNIGVCMSTALYHYKLINKVLPERIVIYRDGVGDGQVSNN